MISRKEFVKRWAMALEARRASVFIGAGLSISAGYPDWRTLLRDIARDIGLDISNETDLAGVAQYSINRSAGNRNKLKAAIIEHFPPKHIAPEPFRILARLPLRHVWTSNYDTLPEIAWERERKLLDVKAQNSDLGHELPWAQTVLYKMHGTVTHPSDVVIAKDDYELYRRERPGFLHLLTGHLVSMEMLFLGFSFTDPNLAHLFSSIEDGMPDVLLWNPTTDRLWVIEAVTSDGEADLHKVSQLSLLAERSGKAGINFTTTYRTWKDAASRQGSHQNIAVGTYIWIQADPAKHLLVQSFN